MFTTGAHILVFPFPPPGHIIPIIDLTHLLLTRGLIVTVLVTPTNLPLLEPLISTHSSSSIQTLVLSPPDSPTSPKLPFIAKMCAWRELHRPIVHWFRSHPNPPVAIVSDFFLGWTHNLSRDLGVPRVVFWSSGAFTSLICNSTWRYLPKRDNPDDDNCLISFPGVPNSPIYPWWQMFFLFREYKEGDPDWEFFRNSMLDNTASWGVVFNSFTELERVYIDQLKEDLGHDRVWAVGPLLPLESLEPTNRGGSTSVPAHEIMTWLDGKGDESVVYVCFGSRHVLTDDQMEVLAAAIEYSRVNFIWCVKAADEGNVAIVDGLEDRVKGRGFVIRGWAPQVSILRHRAVVVFVTHCGWNSVLEGLTSGVMMLTWPLNADQFINAKLLVDQLGVAIRACEGGKKSVPDSAEFSRLLVESVSGSQTERIRVKKIRDGALAAIRGGGSSSRDLDEFAKRLGELKVEEL